MRKRKFIKNKYQCAILKSSPEENKTRGEEDTFLRSASSRLGCSPGEENTRLPVTSLGLCLKPCPSEWYSHSRRRSSACRNVHTHQDSPPHTHTFVCVLVTCAGSYNTPSSAFRYPSLSPQYNYVRVSTFRPLCQRDAGTQRFKSMQRYLLLGAEPLQI